MFFNKKKKLAKQMMLASSKGDIEKIKTLLALGVDINDGKGAMALCNASSNGHVECVRFLLAQGARVDGLNAFGCTPLICAADHGHIDVVDVLLAAGANPHLRGRGRDKNAPPRDAYEWAVLKGRVEIAIKLSRLDGSKAKIKDPDEVIFERSMAGRLLQDVFNFQTLERISLIRKDGISPIEAMTCTGFSALEDQGQLRAAFEEHVKRGGKVEAGRVFGQMISKPLKKE